MPPIRIFISSAQKEFARERAVLRDYMRGDVLMQRFFEAFLFEDMPANGRPLSATEREFNYAGQLGKLRLIFLKGAAHTTRDARMAALIARAEGELVRKRFQTAPELISGLYAALVEIPRGQPPVAFRRFRCGLLPRCRPGRLHDLIVRRAGTADPCRTDMDGENEIVA